MTEGHREADAKLKAQINSLEVTSEKALTKAAPVIVVAGLALLLNAPVVAMAVSGTVLAETVVNKVRRDRARKKLLSN